MLRKHTLVGLQPFPGMDVPSSPPGAAASVEQTYTAAAPEIPPQALQSASVKASTFTLAETSARHKATLIGIPVPEAQPPSTAAAPTASSLKSTLLGLPVPASHEPSAPAPPPDPPTGVAKPYLPKEGPDTPAVVVEPAVLAAGARAAEARAQTASRAESTIPGTMRGISSSPYASPAPDVPAPRSTKGPVIAAIFGVLLLGSGVLAYVLNTGGQEPVPAANQAPTPAVATPPAAVTGASPSGVRKPEVAAEPEAVEPSAAEDPIPDTSRKAADSAAGPAAPAASTLAEPAQTLPQQKPVRRTAPARKPPAKRAPTPAAPAPKPKSVIVRESPF